MTMQQIEFFLVLQKNMNFTEAAEELYISQSSLSKQIKALENELNVVLFERSTRKILLTPAGKDFAMHADKIFSDYNRMLHNMEQYQPNTHNKLTLISVPMLSHYGITNKIADFLESHPNIELTILERETSDVITELRNRTADMSILFKEHLPNDEFQFRPLFVDEMVLVVGKSHRLASREQVSMRDLTNEVFLLVRSDEYACKDTLQLCMDNGFVPKASSSNLRLSSIVEYLLNGYYVTLLNRKSAESIANPDIRIIPIIKSPPRTLGFAYNDSELSPAAAQFMDYIFAQFPHEEESNPS